MVKIGAAQIFSKENLESLIDFSIKAKEMAEKGLKAVRTYKKEVESKAEEFALQIIGARNELRDKFIAASHSLVEIDKTSRNISDSI